jgi:hypothetical protein
MIQLILLAASHKHDFDTGSSVSGPSMSLCWAIVGFMVILGLLVTLSPTRRTTEIKKPQED